MWRVDWWLCSDGLYDEGYPTPMFRGWYSYAIHQTRRGAIMVVKELLRLDHGLDRRKVRIVRVPGNTDTYIGGMVGD